MSKLWKIAGIATLVAILGAATIGAAAFAQEAEDGEIWGFSYRERFKEAVAEILGISVEEYDAAIQQAGEKVLDDAVAEGYLTEDQAQQMRERAAERGFGSGMMPGMPGGRMMPGRGGRMHGPDNSFFAVAAEALDMETEDLLAEIQEGKTIADLAAEKGINTQDIVDAYVAQTAESLDQAVADGKITQTQADSMLERAREHATDMLDMTWEDCGPGGFRHGGFPGGAPEPSGQKDA